MRASELVLNADGSVYHLNLLPGDVAPLIILVGDPGRVTMVSRHFDTIRIQKSKREFITHTGSLNGQDLTVMSTGIGTDNIDIVINEIDALFNLDLQKRLVKDTITPLTFVRIGTSGALREEIPVDSVVLSRYALGLDAMSRMGMSFSDAISSEWIAALRSRLAGSDIPFEPAYIAKASPALAEPFQEWAQPWVTVTCAGFYGLQGRSLRLQSNQTALFHFLRAFDHRGMRVGNLEMETAAIYLFAGLLGHQALSLNTILANRESGTFSRDPHAAVSELITRTLRTLTGNL